MTTMELDAYRAELARQILNTDSRELLDAVRRTISRITKREAKEEDLTPYTMEELHARIAEAESEIDAGIPGIPHKEMMSKMHEMLSEL